MTGFGSASSQGTSQEQLATIFATQLRSTFGVSKARKRILIAETASLQGLLETGRDEACGGQPNFKTGSLNHSDTLPDAGCWACLADRAGAVVSAMRKMLSTGSGAGWLYSLSGNGVNRSPYRANNLL